VASKLQLILNQVLPSGPSVALGMIGKADFGPASSGSSGGWQIVDRPRQKGITQWYDASPMELDADLILDGGGSSIEGDKATMFGWQYPPKGALQPAALSAAGPIDVEAKGLFWVLQNVKFDDDKVVRDNTGILLQQQLSIVLYEYLPAYSSVLQDLSPAQAAQLRLTAAGTVVSRRTYVVRTGDSLAAIAARVLGNAALWTEIATLNNIRDPRNLTVGQRIVLPS
jgi:hypothetical protein